MWDNGIYLNLTFRKSACHKLTADIKIVLVLRSSQELCFLEYQRQFAPDFANCSAAAFPDIRPANSRKCSLRLMRRHIGSHPVKYLFKTQ